jgi:hypothetical protein
MRERLLNLIVIPLGLAILVPLALLFGVWFYIAALKEGVVWLLQLILRKESTAAPVQRPHRAGIQRAVPTSDPAQPSP